MESSYSTSEQATMEFILPRLYRLAARLEARIEASERRWATAFPPSWSEPDPPFSRPLDWRFPMWDPGLNGAYSESYRGGGGYCNNYNNYYNSEPQAWPYNTYESDPYNHVPQSVQYEQPPLAQYYSVAEPPQQQHYYPPPPSSTHVSDVNATLQTDVIDSEIQVDARGDEIVVDPQTEGTGEEEFTPIADLKLEVADVDVGSEQQLSELQTEPIVGGDEPNPAMEEVDEEKELSSAEHDEALGIDSERRDKVGEENGDFMEKDLEFGDGDSNQGIEEQRWKLIGQYIASNGGVVTAEELAPYLDVETIERTDDDSYILPVLLQFDDLPEVDDESRIVEEVFLEVSRRLVIFGLYALAEVYKDRHLEDKVIFKGGGVDTSRFYFN